MSKRKNCFPLNCDSNLGFNDEQKNGGKKLKLMPRNVRIVLIDFSNSFFRVGDDDQNEIRRWELLLKKKFSLQQEGKKKWLLNRELKYKHFFPIEFMNDKEFVLNHTKKYGYGLEFASPKLKQDRDFLMQVIQLSKDGFKVDVGN
ncbi:hypothetical protein FDP41_006048 [Naegleria fowleri]|uniref:DUF4116 domain-containing protein n=1 Tax=Naegleria fowleri TaxID=5763 RepID=A0A6A5BA11_NAEFO|nr:uncharacterized protein FDP41_006048 [Naegleria fowleri]KAF0974943.1 hypothetical protein FDP41_006048 [Naegleria fowleri]